jgi:hypothetical protein
MVWIQQKVDFKPGQFDCERRSARSEPTRHFSNSKPGIDELANGLGTGSMLSIPSYPMVQSREVRRLKADANESALTRSQGPALVGFHSGRSMETLITQPNIEAGQRLQPISGSDTALNMGIQKTQPSSTD